jgi:hypothetical protein
MHASEILDWSEAPTALGASKQTFSVKEKKSEDSGLKVPGLKDSGIKFLVVAFANVGNYLTRRF